MAKQLLTERQTVRKTDRQKVRKTERQTERETERQKPKGIDERRLVPEEDPVEG